MVVNSVSAVTAKEWLDEGQAVLIDVREPAEHAAMRIPGAKTHPLGQLSASALSDQPCKLVLHCHSGRRSSQACERLIAENSGLQLYNLEGGIVAWQQAGLPTHVGARKILPLDRQVQLTIGLVLLLASIATHYFDPNFVYLTALIGIGLTIAGLTGFCGLARLIALAPWNQNAGKSCCG